jgi:hypothetical protein
LVEAAEDSNFGLISKADFAGCVGFIDPNAFTAMKAVSQ